MATPKKRGEERAYRRSDVFAKTEETDYEKEGFIPMYSFFGKSSGVHLVTKFDGIEKTDKDNPAKGLCGREVQHGLQNIAETNRARLNIKEGKLCKVCASEYEIAKMERG